MAQLGRYGAIGSTFLPTFMYYWYKFLDSRIVSTKPQMIVAKVLIDQGFTGKSLSEALLFSEHGENMLCTKIVLNVRNSFCTQHVLTRFELGIFMY